MANKGRGEKTEERKGGSQSTEPHAASVYLIKRWYCCWYDACCKLHAASQCCICTFIFEQSASR